MCTQKTTSTSWQKPLYTFKKTLHTGHSHLLCTPAHAHFLSIVNACWHVPVLSGSVAWSELRSCLNCKLPISSTAEITRSRAKQNNTSHQSAHNFSSKIMEWLTPETTAQRSDLHLPMLRQYACQTSINHTGPLYGRMWQKRRRKEYPFHQL